MSFRRLPRASGSIALALVLLAGGALAQACGEDTNGGATNATPDGGGATVAATPPPPVSTPTQASATVGTGGGNVKTTLGTGVEIPPGALSGNVNITVAEAQSLTPSGAVGSAYQLGPAGLPFSAPVTVVLDLDPTKLPSGKTTADVVVMTAQDGTTSFTELTTTLRDATHVAAQTTHFSIFVPMLAGALADAGNADAGGADGGAADAGETGGGDDAGSGGNDAAANDAGSGAGDASTDDAGGGASDAASDDAGGGAADAAGDGAPS